MEDLNFDMVVLIVDDSLSMRRIVKKFFENNGFHHMIEAENGIQALEILKEKKVQLIVSDLNMPEMDGMEFLKTVKSDAQLQQIPFVLLTVEAIQKTMNEALGYGVDSYIVKPITEKLFLREINRVIQERNAR